MAVPRRSGSLTPKSSFSNTDNPCVRNCCLDDEDICLGCGRALKEITAWSGLSDAEKQAVLRAAEARKQARNKW